jgi:hypothetical protein
MSSQQTEFPMTVAVCAWCKPVPAGSGVGNVSHGICPRHLRKLRIELLKKRARPVRNRLTKAEFTQTSR